MQPMYYIGLDGSQAEDQLLLQRRQWQDLDLAQATNAFLGRSSGRASATRMANGTKSLHRPEYQYARSSFSAAQ